MAARGGCELLVRFCLFCDLGLRMNGMPCGQWTPALIWAVDIGHKMIDLLLIRAENFSAFGRWQRHSRDCWLSEAF